MLRRTVSYTVKDADGNVILDAPYLVETPDSLVENLRGLLREGEDETIVLEIAPFARQFGQAVADQVATDQDASDQAVADRVTARG